MLPYFIGAFVIQIWSLSLKPRHMIIYRTSWSTLTLNISSNPYNYQEKEMILYVHSNHTRPLVGLAFRPRVISPKPAVFPVLCRSIACFCMYKWIPQVFISTKIQSNPNKAKIPQWLMFHFVTCMSPYWKVWPVLTHVSGFLQLWYS